MQTKFGSFFSVLCVASKVNEVAFCTKIPKVILQNEVSYDNKMHSWHLLDAKGSSFKGENGSLQNRKATSIFIKSKHNRDSVHLILSYKWLQGYAKVFCYAMSRI